MRFVVALLAAAPLVNQAHGLRGAPCFEACQMVLHPIKFNDTAGLSPSPPTRQCQSHKGLASLYLCSKVFCSIEERTAGLQFHNGTCHNKVNESIPSFDLIANYTDDKISNLDRFEKQDWIDGTTFQDALLPSDVFFGLAYDTLASWSYANEHHYLYGAAMFVFWGLVVALGVLNKASSFLRYKTKSQPVISHSALHSEDDALIPSKKSRLDCLRVWLKAHLLLPATFGHRKAQPFDWYTVPPRIESLTILSFVIVNIVFTVRGYHVFSGNLYYPEVISQLLRYVSDRTGIIAFANFPLIWLFGMRNNILLWMTGWDFATYNNFHRWVARVATVQAVIHSLGYTILVFHENGWTQFVAYWHQTWWITGELATILMCALLPLSLYWLRRHMYEGFLIIHIALSILVLATMWGHIYPFSFGKVAWDGLIWVSCSIWVIDRVTRMTRTLSFNRRFWNTRAQAIYERDSNIVRLSIPTSQSWHRPPPGTFYYLHFLNDRRFWESHPFTMSMIRRGPVTGTGLLSHASFDSAEGMGLLSADDEVESLKSDTTHLEAATMNFIIRPYDSSTRRLALAAEMASPRAASTRVLVEGPYGHTQPFHRYHSILFVVGGSGIVSALVHLEELCRDVSQTRNIHIVWAVREAAFAASVLREDIADLHESGKLTMDIYVTAHGGHPDLEILPQGVSKHLGRPDIRGEVESAVHRFGSTGRLAIVACAPARMADDARKAVVDTLAAETSLRSSSISVDYFEEGFNW